MKKLDAKELINKIDKIQGKIKDLEAQIKSKEKENLEFLQSLYEVAQNSYQKHGTNMGLSYYSIYQALHDKLNDIKHDSNEPTV